MMRVCVAGATGWVGQALLPAIEAADDLELVGAVSRSAAGRPVRDAVPGCVSDTRIAASVAEALSVETDVLVEYTAPAVAKAHVLEAVCRGVAVVVGTSGLGDDAYAEIDDAAREHGVSVLAAGNFAIAAVLLLRFAEMAARLMPSWEVIDYADAAKMDAPSGTARELANRLAAVAAPRVEVPVANTEGSPESRGLGLHGMQVHSIRLPGFVIGAEVIFGRPDERLTLRYDGGSSAAPYVGGTLLAVRHARGFTGLRRGLDQLLEV